MAIGTSAAPYMKFENKGDRCGGEIVDFRVVQNRDQKTRMALYLQENDGKWAKVNNAYAPDGKPNDPICQWEITVETGIEDADGDTERRIFVDFRKGRRGTTVEGKKGGDAIASALKKVKAHRTGLEIGGWLFVTFEGKVNDGDAKVNTWSAEYEPPVGGVGTGKPVDETPWLVGGGRYDKAAELAKWEAARGAAPAPSPEVPAREMAPLNNHASSPVLNPRPAAPAYDDEPPF